MPSDRVVHAALRETTRGGVADLVLQKDREAEWSRVRSQFKEPTIGDYRTTVTLPENNLPPTTSVSVAGARQSDYSIAAGSAVMNFTTYEVFDGPPWLKALREKKNAVESSRRPLVEVDSSATLEQLVHATTATSPSGAPAAESSPGNSSMILSPSQRGDRSEPPSSTLPLLNEETCAWKRCLWLQERHRQQFAPAEPSAPNAPPSSTFLDNCAWLRSLRSVQSDDAAEP